MGLYSLSISTKGQKGVIESLERYISYMEIREIALREQYDIPDHKVQMIFYNVW